MNGTQIDLHPAVVTDSKKNPLAYRQMFINRIPLAGNDQNDGFINTPANINQNLNLNGNNVGNIKMKSILNADSVNDSNNNGAE